MKKFLSILILSFLAIVCAAGFIACDNGGNTPDTPTTPHTHAFVDFTVEPTCTEQGYTLHKCACGEEYKDNYTNKIAHSYVNGKCVVCDANDPNYGEPIDPVHTHDFIPTVIPATCTTGGYTLRVCSCGEEKRDSETAALGHNYEWTITKEPTETEQGIETGVCIRCKHTLTRNIPELTHTHNYIETKIEPTCAEYGYVIYKCYCGSEYTGSFLPRINHEYNTVVTEPTCTEIGYTSYTCSMCGYTYTGNYVDTLGHEYGEWNIIKEPTCHETGSKIGYCSRDNAHIETRIIQSKHNSLEAGDICELCGYSVLKKIGDSVLMTDGNDYLSAEFYGSETYNFGSPIQEYITNIYFSDSVTSIRFNSFSDCISLTSITIPDSVTSIGNYAFGWCRSLTSITIPDSVTSIGHDAFFGCSSLTSVTIPDGVTSIESGAFSYCSSLTSITIPDSVTSIESGAFRNCSSLTSITIPDNVGWIEYDAFAGCSALTDICFNGTKMKWNVIGNHVWYADVPATVVHCSNGDVAI